MKNPESRDDQNLARLLQAGYAPDSRPEPAARQQAWERLQAVWRAEYGPEARSQGKVQAPNPAAVGKPTFAPVSEPFCSEPPAYQNNNKPERNPFMRLLLRNRWGFGLGAAAVAAVVLIIIGLATPRAQARAVEIMAKGAQAIANLTTVHLRGQLRTLPADNFSYINPDQDFYPIELWKEFGPDGRWRVEKPGRVVVMDGQSVVMYIKPANEAGKLPQRASSAFDTQWLHQIANLSNTISNELRHAQAQGWKLDLTEETAPDGRAKAVVTVHATSGLPDDDYSKNSFFQNADTRRVYRFDEQSERLEAVQVYLLRNGGEVQIFDLSQIDYNQPIEPALWRLELPADVSWYQQPQKLPDNDKYAAMSAQEAARAFFEACGRENWEEVGKFMSPVTDRLKSYLGGVEIVSLGQPFTSKAYPGQFVPYEIKLRGMEINLRLSNNNPANRYVFTGVYDSKLKLMQDLKWPKAPEVLPNNDVYAKMTPVEAVKAYIAAQAKLDWEEMKKFAPESDVENDKRKLEAALKKDPDARQVMPQLEVGKAVWSAEQSAYFVKCRVSAPVKKHNVALRKDNPAGRWQVDGGI